MQDRPDPMPVALYARVSGDRPDIDLSVAVGSGAMASCSKR